MKRRVFIGFFLFGGIISLLKRNLSVKLEHREKKALFWKVKS